MQGQEPNLYLTTASYYDRDNEVLGTVDIDFYRELGLKIGGPVLDLCCGTGRIALPLTMSGLDVTAVDLSEPMLSLLRKKLPSEHRLRIEIVHGDMRYLKLNRTFSLIIIALRSFQVLQDPEDIELTFATLHRHLCPGGILVIDIFKPLEDMKSIEGITEQREFKDQEGKLLYKRYGINRCIDTQNQILHCDFEYWPVEKIGNFNPVKEHLKIRYYYKDEFHKLLQRHGFRVDACYGDYNQLPTDDESASELLFICQEI